MISSLVDLCVVNIILNKKDTSELGSIKKDINSVFNQNELSYLSFDKLFEIALRNKRKDILSYLKKNYFKYTTEKYKNEWKMTKSGKYKSSIFTYDPITNRIDFLSKI